MEKILKGSKIMRVINLFIIVSFIIAPIYPAFAEDLAENLVVSEAQETTANIDTAITEDPPKVEAEKVDEVLNEEPVEPIDEKEPLAPLGADNSQKIEPLKVSLGDVDERSGAFVYSYDFPLPPFRNMSPELSLTYNSQNESKNSVTGYGWELSIPYIRYVNREGSNSIYNKNYFYSSISGELTPIIVDNNFGDYGSKKEDGTYLNYTRHNDNHWTLKTKNGTVYTFGLNDSSRQSDPNDLNKVYTWYLTSIQDLNGNTIQYTYTKETGQVYPSTMTYGPYNISLSYVTANNNQTSQYSSGFQIKSGKKLDKVEILFNSSQERVFNIFYTLPQFNRVSLIDKIIDNSIPANPQVTEFNYAEETHNFTRDPDWDMPYNSNTNTGLTLNSNSTFIDINNDGLIDFVYTSINPIAFVDDGDTEICNDYTDTVFINTGTDFERDPTWKMPCYQSGNNYYKMALGSDSTIIDINKDGLPDFVFTGNGVFVSGHNDTLKTVFLNNGHDFIRDSNWDMPYNASTNMAIPLNKNSTFADINGDGLPDFIATSSANGQFVNDHEGSIYNDYTNTVFINTGTDFERNVEWVMPYYSSGSTNYKLRLDTNSIFTDLNNDGMSDFFYTSQGTFPSNSSTHAVFLNNGSGFIRQSDWIMPYNTSNNSALLLTSQNSMFADLNNDGLLDFIYTSTGVFYDSNHNDPTKTVFINTGHSFVRDSNWSMPYNDSSGLASGVILGTYTSFTDINSDGLTDFIYNNTGAFTSGITPPYNDSLRTVFINNGTDFVRDSNWSMPYYLNVTTPSALPITTTYGIFIDINNDSLADFVNTDPVNTTFIGGSSPYNDQIKTVFINDGPNNIILESINTSSGGTVEVTYLQKEIENLFPSDNRQPASVRVVNSISYDDLVNAPSTTNYAYEEGRYYYDTDTCQPNCFKYKKFAGFATTTKIDPNGNVTKTYYHQGNETNEDLGEYMDNKYKITKPYRIEEYDSMGHLYRVTIKKWYTFNIDGYSFVSMYMNTILNYDGNNTHSDTSVIYGYDNFGNVIYVTNFGKVTAGNDGNFADLEIDSTSENLSYANTGTNFYSDQISQSTILDHYHNKIKETKIYYDNQALGLLIKGNPTKIEQWVKRDSVLGDIYINNQKTYNTYGLVTTDTDPRGKITYYNYDSYNLYPQTITNPLNKTTQYLYDYSSGKVKQVINENGLTYQTVYDGLDRVIEEKVPSLITPYLPVTRTSYIYTDTPGAISIQKNDYLDEFNTVNTYQYYDGLGRLIQERQEAEIDGNFNVTDRVYDDRGLVSKQSLPYKGNDSARTPRTTEESLYINNTYDPLGRVLTTSDSTGTINYTYDDWKTTVVDKNGKIKSYYKNAFDNLIKVEETNSGSIYTTVYNWNSNNQLIKITDALGNIRNFTYDNLGRRLSAEDLHAPLDTTFGLWTYTYDNNSNLVKTISPRSLVTNYTYNDLNQLLTEDYTGATGTEISYSYGECSNGIMKLCTVTMSSGVITNYNYNSNGNVATESKKINNVTYATSYSYGNLGNITSIIYPDGAEVKYTYNTAGLLEKIETREAGQDFSDVVSDFDYNPMNQIVREIYPNNTITDNTYDANNLYRLTFSQTGGNNKLKYLNYTYDPTGNIIKIMDSSDTDNVGTITYTYDDLNRLISSSASGQNSYTQNFTYNPIGNITESPSGTYQYQGNTGVLKANPHAATSIGGANNTYDANGNLLSNGIVNNTWNYKDQLTKIIKNSVSSNYVYDQAGERVSFTTQEESTIYPNDYYNVYRDYGTKNSTKKTKQIYGNGQLVATIETTLELDPDDNVISVVKPYYLHTDHLGSISVITNENGDLVKSLNYYPYGSPRTSSGDYLAQRQYIGEMYDSNTGLDYLNARYYDGNKGRFVSQDPQFWGEQNLMDPQSLNSYSYARNNPVNLSDPSGLSVFTDYVDYKRGEMTGVINSTVNTVVGLGELVLYTSTPYMLYDSSKAANIVRSIPKIPSAIWQDAKENYGLITSGDPYQTGVGVGNVEFDVALLVAGGFESKATTGVAEGLGSSARIESILKPGGRWIGTAGSGGVRVLPGGEAAANKLYAELADGGASYTGGTYSGTAVRFENGNFVGIRTKASKLSAGTAATIDVKMGDKFTKFKFQK